MNTAFWRLPAETIYLAIGWTALVLTASLSLQGAIVRATGSGDGCGRYWPTCHSEIIPSAPSLEAVLGFSHRLLTVLLAVLGLWLLYCAFRSRRERPGPGLATLGAAFFFALQSLGGAATVTFGLTGDDASLARNLVLTIHLAKSVSMLGALLLAVLDARQRAPGRRQLGKQPPLQWRRRPNMAPSSLSTGAVSAAMRCWGSTPLTGWGLS